MDPSHHPRLPSQALFLLAGAEILLQPGACPPQIEAALLPFETTVECELAAAIDHHKPQREGLVGCLRGCIHVIHRGGHRHALDLHCLVEIAAPGLAVRVWILKQELKARDWVSDLGCNNEQEFGLIAKLLVEFFQVANLATKDVSGKAAEDQDGGLVLVKVGQCYRSSSVKSRESEVISRLPDGQ